MPFAKRIVDPIRLSRKPVGAEYKFDLDIISNNTLVGCIQQLASVAKKADEIFSEIAQECQNVVQKTTQLKNRVKDVGKRVEVLNAKAVKIPVSDLTTFASETDHFAAEHGFDCYLFTPGSRPDTLSDLYEKCTVSPLKTIRRCNILRTDGKTGSRIFSLTPVLQNDKTDEADTDINFRKPVVVGSFEREHKELQDPSTVRKRPRSLSALTEIDIHTNTDKIPLPTPEDRLREISRSQPVTLVPIDTSGGSFSRICEQRESQRSINREYVDGGKGTVKRTKRRQTLSGIPGFVYEELTNDSFKIGSIRTRSVSRERWERPRSMHMPDHMYVSHPEIAYKGRRSRSRERRKDKHTRDSDDSPVSRSCSLRRSFRSLFRGSRSKSKRTLWASGRAESPGPPVIDVGVPLRRSKSLPRSLRAITNSNSGLNVTRSASTEGRLDAWSEEEDHDEEEERGEEASRRVQGKPPKPPSVSNRLSRMHRSRSHTYSLRMSTFRDSWGENSLGRPKSMDLTPRQPIPVAMPTTPSSDSIASNMTGNESLSSQMNIPPGQPAWTAFAADVKLRQHAKDKDIKEDRQSSSGNWSGSSSSARQSLESEYMRNAGEHRRSQTSLDKDSALSLNIHSSSAPSEERYDTTDNNNADETSTVTGETSTITGDTSTINGDPVSDAEGSVIDIKENFTKMTADDWLKSTNSKDRRKSLHRKSRVEGSSSSTDTQRSGHGLTRKNLRAHDYAHLPIVRQPSRTGDEESSVYSVDQEGFYTSMHKDSGLYKGRSFGDTLYEEEERPVVLSSFASSSESTLNGLASNMNMKKDRRRRSAGFFSNLPSLRKLNGKGGKKLKKIPPPPPPRVSTKLDKSNLTLHMDENEMLHHKPGESLSPPPSASSVKSLPLPGAPARDRKSISPPHSHLNDSSCESDAEAIYARLKMKTSISTAAFPPMCNVTPVQSDEEDSDLLTFTGDIYGSLQSTKSAPGTLVKNSPVTPTSKPVSPYQVPGRAGMNAPPMPVLPGAGTIVAIDVSGCSTWPRSPVLPDKDQNPLSSFSTDYTPPVPPPRLNQGVAPKKMFTDEDEVLDSRLILDGARTPDAALDDDRSTLARSNSFRGSTEGSVGQASVHSSGKASSSLQSYPTSHSSSSIPSSLSDEQQPPLPTKYQHIIKVRPGKANEKPGKAHVNITHIDDPKTEVTRDHIYANVIIDNKSTDPGLSSPSSVGSTGFGLGPPIGVASSTPKDLYGSKTSYMGTWPRAAKTPTSPTSPTSKGSKDDTHSPSPMATSPLLSPTPSNKSSEYDTSTFPRKTDKMHFATAKVASIPVPKPVPYTGPVPAPAQLIISSPVATKVSFKENPYKRSVCSPVTTQELLSLWNCNVKDKPYHSHSAVGGEGATAETNIDAALKEADSGICVQGMLAVASPLTPLSQPMFPNLGSMKHSITFPVEHKSTIVPSDYGRTWYDGITEEEETKTPESLPEGYFQMKPQMAFSTFLKDEAKPCSGSGPSVPFDQRRGSVSSSISTDSGGKTKNFASIKKASPASSRSSLQMSPTLERANLGATERQVPKFTSFNKSPEAVGQPVGMKRSASAGKENKTPVQVPVVKPVPQPVVQPVPQPVPQPVVQPVPQPVVQAVLETQKVLPPEKKSPSPPRPTHLSLFRNDSFKKAVPYNPGESTKAAEPSAKRFKTTGEKEQNKPEEGKKVMVKATVNPTQRRPSPVRVVFPHTPEKKANSSPKSVPARPKVKPPAPPRAVTANQKSRSPSPKAGSPAKNTSSPSLFKLPALAPWPGVSANKNKVTSPQTLPEKHKAGDMSKTVSSESGLKNDIRTKTTGNSVTSPMQEQNRKEPEKKLQGTEPVSTVFRKGAVVNVGNSSPVGPKSASAEPKVVVQNKPVISEKCSAVKSSKVITKKDNDTVKMSVSSTEKALKKDLGKQEKKDPKHIKKNVKEEKKSPKQEKKNEIKSSVLTRSPVTQSSPQRKESSVVATSASPKENEAVSPASPARPSTPANPATAITQANPQVTPTKKPVLMEASTQLITSPVPISPPTMSRPSAGPVLAPPSVTRPSPGPVLTSPPKAAPLTPSTASRPRPGPMLAPPPTMNKAKPAAKETTFDAEGDVTTTSPSLKYSSPASKPPPSPAAHVRSVLRTPPVRTKSRSLSMCSNHSDSDKPSQPSISSSLNKSSLSLTLSNSSFSLLNTSTNLTKSTTSLARSTDSLASNSSASARAERTRMAKLAFLAQQEESMNAEPPKIDDRFARFGASPKKITDSKLSTKTNSTDSNKNICKDINAADRTSDKRKDSIESNGSCSPKCPSTPDRPSPVQGRFVSSMINQFQTRGDSPTSPISGSSGLGSSIPNSPSSNSSRSPEKVSSSSSLVQQRLRSSSGSSNSSASPPCSPTAAHNSLKSLLHKQRTTLRPLKQS